MILEFQHDLKGFDTKKKNALFREIQITRKKILLLSNHTWDIKDIRNAVDIYLTDVMNDDPIPRRKRLKTIKLDLETNGSKSAYFNTKSILEVLKPLRS